MKRTIQEEEAKIVQLYQDGLSTLHIAKELNIGQGTVYRVLKRNNVKLRWPTTLVTPEEIEAIRQLCNQGVGIRAIADKFNVSISPIQRIMRENGIESKYEWHSYGEKHQSWKGGKQINTEGYVLVWIDPKDPISVMAKTDNYVLEHRLVMARFLGRPLKSYETVHHINGNRQDNRIENLQLRLGQHGSGQVYCCADCGSRNIVQCAIND